LAAPTGYNGDSVWLKHGCSSYNLDYSEYVYQYNINKNFSQQSGGNNGIILENIIDGNTSNCCEMKEFYH